MLTNSKQEGTFKNKAFTLIELLAVIVILAIIALIAVPQILKVLSKSRKGAAEDSTLGLVEAAESYTANLMLKNSGGVPNLTLVFECSDGTCSLSDASKTLLDGYVYTENLEYKGTNVKSGKIIIKNNGQKIIVDNINLNSYDCNYTNNKARCIDHVENRYTEELLNGADPVLSENLVPVVISSNGTVSKADLTTQWYKYENKNWANAVILYGKDTYKSGDTIPESAIKQYYVWIPRYRYKLWNVNGEQKYPNDTTVPSAINIEFESVAETESNGSQNGEWLTHPAFTNFETNGIWVGKFETSYDQESFTNSDNFATNTNTASATSPSNIIIKPNVRSLTNKPVSQFYTFGRGAAEDENSHMMTNMEWGATAYLTYSLYGKCTNSSCEEVYINNVNTGYGDQEAVTGVSQYGPTVTGCSGAASNSAQSAKTYACASGYAWNGSSNKASTTGNITGIYDMNGGNWEYVMGVITIDGQLVSGRASNVNSGFNGIYSYTTGEKTNGLDYPDSKYYNLYALYGREDLIGTDIYTVHTAGLLGDATKEVSKENASTGLWFSDYAVFASAAGPWFFRGGSAYSGGAAGVFNFYRSYGSSYTSCGFRVVLAY